MYIDFFGELFWFYFTMNVAGAYVHNSWGKSVLSDNAGTGISSVLLANQNRDSISILI